MFITLDPLSLSIAQHGKVSRFTIARPGAGDLGGRGLGGGRLVL